MANFQTHLTVATVGTGIVTIAALASMQVAPLYGLLFWGAGIVGGLLPDIDADNSKSLQIISNIISVLLLCFLMVGLSHLKPMILVMIALGALLAVRFILLPVIRRMTIHRGNWHSLLAGIASGLVVTNVCYHYLNFPPQVCWLTGIFLSLGFLIHLILDEIWAINLEGMTLKRSFGSAIKPFQANTPWHTTSITALAGVMLWLAPALSELHYALKPFVKMIYG